MPHAPIASLRRRARIAAVLLSAALLASCTVGPSVRPDLATSGGTAPTHAGSSTADSMPLGPGGGGRTADPIQWVPCPSDVPTVASDGTAFDVECGEILAPISPPQPRRGTLTLSVARALPTGAATDLPPLVVLTTSRSHTEIAEVAASLPESVTRRFSVVMADARGTGASTGIDCISEATARAIVGMAADPTTAEGAQQLAGIARQLTFDCGDAVGPALTKLNSTNAADDLDVLRAALDMDRLTILAEAGGATVGAVYVHRYPGRVAAAVLSSPRDPLTGPAAHALAVAAAAQSAFDDFVLTCPEFPGGCPLGADPGGTVQDLVDRWAASGQTSGAWVMTGGSILLALLTSLPDRDRWPHLAQAIADLGAGDAGPLADLVVGALGGDTITAALTSRLVYTCNDDTDRLSAEDVADLAEDARQKSPMFGAFASSLAGLCGSWPAPDEPLERLSGAGAPPVLVVGSSGAITAPFDEVRAVAGQLSSAVLVTWQSSAPDPYPANPCVAAVADGYLLDGTVPERGVLCPP